MLDSIVGQYGYVAVFLLVGGEALGIPLPGELTLLAAAVYAGTGRLSIEWVIVVAALGATMGGAISYLVGWKAGRPLLVRYGRYLRIDEAKLVRAERFFARHGDKAIFFARFVTVLRTFGCFLAGVNRMSPPRFLIFNTAGAIVWATLYGFLAYAFGAAVFDRVARIVGLGGLVLVVLAGIAVFFLRRRSRRVLRPTEKPPGTAHPPTR